MKFNKQKIKLFASCRVVKGSQRSIICDLQRMNFKLIPNDLIDLLQNCEGKTLAEIKENNNNEDNEVIEEYFDFLIENEYIFFTNNPEFFPDMNLEWFEPFEINNAVIDYCDNFNLENILFQLEILKCKSIEIRFFNVIELNFIEKILKNLNQISSIISSIGLMFENSSESKKDVLSELIINYPRISYLIITNSSENNLFNKIGEKKGYLYYTKEKVYSSSHCGIINAKNWTVNTRLFTESQKHNTCLNRKISIDKDGNIKNCPSMPQSFGNIKDTTLQEALSHPDFKKYWNVNKDMIAVCKDCEFRHICTDCRAYTERTHFDGEIDLSKPLKCGYNPYTNEWAEWSTNPLKEKAIEYYGMQDLVKKDA